MCGSPRRHNNLVGIPLHKLRRACTLRIRDTPDFVYEKSFIKTGKYSRLNYIQIRWSLFNLPFRESHNRCTFCIASDICDR
jgi:hypothetical protein